MARPCDEAARDVWRRRFRRFGRSGLAVGRFCSQEGVSMASFYYWRKRLGAKTSHQWTRESGCSAEQRQTSVHREVVQPRGAFRPVTIVPTMMPPARGVSIVLPCGTRIEVGAQALDALRAVVGEVMRASGPVGLRHHDMEGGGASC